MNNRYMYRGKVLFVKEYQAVNHVRCATFFVDGKGFERAFFFGDELAARATMAEAQADLDEFAKKRGLAEVSPRN